MIPYVRWVLTVALFKAKLNIFNRMPKGHLSLFLETTKSTIPRSWFLSTNYIEITVSAGE